MKLHPTLPAIIAFLLCTMPISASEERPQPHPPVTYKRIDSEGNWRDVPQSEGETVQTCLLHQDTFKTWGSTIDPGIIAQPIPTVLGFRTILASGESSDISFSLRGELVSCTRGLLVVPEKEKEILAQLFLSWKQSDQQRIVSQPLPCQYRIGSADDGNTLSGIARLFYGDGTKWTEIHNANRTVIQNPDIIRRGNIITIPKLKE